MILFLANYPDEHTRHEGMSQRMVAVDQQYREEKRAYLFVSHRLFSKKETVHIEQGTIQYRCNLFVHFFFILKLIRKAQVLYIHSIINVLPILPVLRFINKKSCVILDAHGIVPEEHILSGMPHKGRLYQLSEKALFRRVDTVITVTRAMERHFRNKYPSARPKYVQYAIVPAHIIKAGEDVVPVESSEQLRIVYSGNAQSWQNIELMMNIIKNNPTKRIRYDLLTGQPEQMKQFLKRAGLAVGENIHLDTVAPDELKDYYQAAHYGFVLRDDVAVNRVACPTKLVEYLHYGIIPIVKSHLIGDFDEMGYEYVHYDDFSGRLPLRKSRVNQALANRLLAESIQVNLPTLLHCHE